MVEVSAPFSELSPASLIVQSSRFSPTEGKLTSHCLREARLTGESFESRHAVRQSIGRFSWNRWKSGCCSRSRRSGSSIGMSDRSASRSGNHSLWGQKGAIRVRLQLWEALSLRRTLFMIAMGGKAYAWRLSQGWRNASTPAALGSHAGAKNTGSLAVSEVTNRSMIAGHWWRRSWTTSWCSVHSDPITRLGRLRRSALVLRDPWMNWGSSMISMDSTHRRISPALRNRTWDLVPPNRLR